MGKEIKRIINYYKSRNLIKKAKKLIKIILEALLEMIYPKENYCIICKKEDCDRICSSCLKTIKPIKKSDLDILSYSFYGGALKQLILKFKYGNDFSAGDILSELLIQYIKENIDYKNYIMTYIPLSRKSKRKRGFNQCEYLAKKISYILEIEVIEVLIKVRETKEQKTLQKYQRENNIKNAFKLKEHIDIKNLNIIVLDDVVTTGSTLKEARRILQENYVNDIKLLTLAKSTI